jgi:hypothetical protein
MNAQKLAGDSLGDSGMKALVARAARLSDANQRFENGSAIVKDVLTD